jgi:hypothetical protein
MFSVSDAESVAPSVNWSIHTFTEHFRKQFLGSTEWVIGISCDGLLIVLDADENVREWDTNTKTWFGASITLSAWLYRLVEEGKRFLSK